MYIYIYDNFVNQKKYESILARIETRITDLGLNGKITRLSIMSSLADTMKNELKKGAKTIVIVGDDSTLNKAISVLAGFIADNSCFKKIPLGFIPINKKNNTIAEYLGLGHNESACDMLSTRRIKTLDLGLVSDNYFLTQANINTKNTIIEIDSTYSIEISEPGEINIINLPIIKSLPKNFDINAQDGALDLFIKTKASKNIFFNKKNSSEQSVFSFKKLNILNKYSPLILDNTLKVKCPATIKLADEKINLIVGKKRLF
ncbi:hypothetical protein KAI65_06140 [Candidatus Parcubacteria bacterium]|nr:hypothetical protein [Candidatus Parcubacteria bacterium]